MITWNDVIKFASKGNPEPERRVEKSDHEWKDLLTVEQYKITRLKGTEPAGTGALCHAHEAGVYSCSCCDTELFDSTIKFESGSGWPSFTQPIDIASVKYVKRRLFWHDSCRSYVQRLRWAFRSCFSGWAGAKWFTVLYKF